MRVTVTKVIPLPEKIRAEVNLYDENAYHHQGCDVIVFLDKKESLNLDQIQSQAIDAAYAFLAQCLSQRSGQRSP